MTVRDTKHDQLVFTKKLSVNMSFFNVLRGFFGMPPEGNNNRFPDYPEERPNEFRNPIWGLDDADDDDDDFRRPRNRFSFPIDSNPLEIHRFFEQQMDSIMRSFGQFGFGNFGPDMFSLEPPPGMDVVPGSPELPPQGGNLRDQFLKPGYEHGIQKTERGKKEDSDLDDKMSVSDVGKMLQQKPPSDVRPEKAFPFGMLQPHGFGSGMSSQSYGRSMSSKTVTRPNGGVEHQKSVRDSAGNEEVTVTRTLGSQSHSVTTKTDASGKQERIENFVNMDEGDLKNFEKKWGSKL